MKSCNENNRRGWADQHWRFPIERATDNGPRTCYLDAYGDFVEDVRDVIPFVGGPWEADRERERRAREHAERHGVPVATALVRVRVEGA